jgi:hypothetical protein
MLQEYYESVGSQLSEDGDGWRRPIKRRILQGRGTGINWVAAWKIELGGSSTDQSVIISCLLQVCLLCQWGAHATHYVSISFNG